MFTPFFTLCPYWVRLYSCFSLQHSLQEKGCCRGLYSTHALSHGPISIQQLYSAVERCRALQLYSGSTVYRLYTLPLLHPFCLYFFGPTTIPVHHSVSCANVLCTAHVYVPFGAGGQLRAVSCGSQLLLVIEIRS